MTTITDRVERRIRNNSSASVITDQSALDPTAYRVDVTGRGPEIERLLDLLEPALSADGQPTVYAWGPKGAGKSTILVGVVRAIRRVGGDDRELFYTSTRTTERDVPIATFLDARSVTSEFAFYRELLASVIGTEAVPTNGISTEELRKRVDSALKPRHAALIVTDHLDDTRAPLATKIASWIDGLEARTSWVASGRSSPDDVAITFDHHLEIEPYRHHTLVDILTGRADAGLTSGSIMHDQLDAIARWAEGDAHDALVALFAAARAAAASDDHRIDQETTARALERLPTECVSLHRVFALPADRRELLYRFGALSTTETASVGATAEALASHPAIELQASTVKRVLYELTEDGLFRRVDGESDGRGRPPSTLEPQFPVSVFMALHDSDSSSDANE